jgi:hypothetical protein
MKTVRPILAVCLAVWLLPALIRAQEEAVTFAQLVKTAQRIFIGNVAGVESFRADLRDGARIRTRVTFTVDETLRGSGGVIVLEFLGGTVGDLTLEVADMPQFVAGERYVVFARDGDRWVNPVVGFDQGLLRVSRDARDGTARVLTAAHAPLASVAAIGHPTSRISRTMSMPMSLPAFVAAIRDELARQK